MSEIIVPEAWTGGLPTGSGGTVVFTFTPTGPFLMAVHTGPCSGNSSATVVKDAALFNGCPVTLPAEAWVGVYVNDGEACLFEGWGAAKTVLKKTQMTGSINGCRRSFWLSFGRCNRTVKYGVGHYREETTLIEAQFPSDGPSAGLFGPAPASVSLLGCGGPFTYCSNFASRTAPATVEMESRPLLRNLPPLVIDSSCLSLLDLGRCDHLPSADLPRACQWLYRHLSAPSVDLNWPPAECDIVDAIRHSLLPGGLLHTRLAWKASRTFAGAHPRQSYLRVSVSPPNGCAPGAPFVLEIWPAGHSSPVHNHGGCFGVVRCLHGEVRTSIFNKDLSAAQLWPLQEMTLRKDDVTWFSPNWYQTHQLINESDDVCITIQGFRYGDEDTIHWPFMAYTQGGGAVYDFEPVSDFTFPELRQSLIEEYTKSAVHKAAAAEEEADTEDAAPDEKGLTGAESASCASDEDMADLNSFTYII